MIYSIHIKNIIIVIFLSLVIVFGYKVFQKDHTLVTPETQTPPTTQTTPLDGTLAPQITSTTPTNTLNSSQQPTNKVVKTDWGISFIGPTGWEKSFNTNQITLLQEGVSAGDGITIDYISGNKITDTDAKFGNVTYYYSDSSQAWIVESPDEQNGGTLPPTTATPALHTTSGLPVFLGTHRWATYIIPLSHTTFLKLNIGGGGNTQPLTELVKTIQKI